MIPIKWDYYSSIPWGAQDQLSTWFERTQDTCGCIPAIFRRVGGEKDVSYLEMPVYELKPEYAEEALAKVFPEERYRKAFENKTLEEQLAAVKIRYWCDQTPQKELRREDMSELIKDSMGGHVDGILMYRGLLLGFEIRYGAALWLGQGITRTEERSEDDDDCNGSGYRSRRYSVTTSIAVAYDFEECL